ncbi:hypothetical protein CN518_24530 [Bacillus anthracis]|nr:hypothetical protein CN518_24530 [Bacillus anthracis]
MWKVKNKINKIYLAKFEEKIIIPIFEIIKEITNEIKIGNIILPAKNKELWKKTKVFRNLNADMKTLYIYIMKTIKEGRSVEEIIYLISSKYDSKYIKSIYELYSSQNRKINEGDYNIQESNLCGLFRGLFVDFYYTKFFIDNKIWMAINGGGYNRKSFHENFRRDNNNLAVCPYCDIDTTVSVSNNNIEHFLPKSKFPLLAMNPLNLISSCIACNKSQEGKGDRISPFPIITPYSEQISNAAEFKPDFFSRKITLINKGEDAHNNYFNLLQLYSRYSEGFIFECINDDANSLFNTISQYSNPSIFAIDQYILERSGKKNLSLALKSVIKTYPRYKLFKGGR